MTNFQRFRRFFGALITFLCAILFLLYPDEGHIAILFCLGISFLISSIRSLLYFFSMARHMVGGKLILYKGIILLDLAVFTLILRDVPTYYIMLYLLSSHAFSGVIEILIALDARRLQTPSWRLNLGTGIINLMLCVFCIITIRSTRMMVYVYSFGLIYSSIMHLVSACRKTAIAYIP